MRQKTEETLKLKAKILRKKKELQETLKEVSAWKQKKEKEWGQLHNEKERKIEEMEEIIKDLEEEVEMVTIREEEALSALEIRERVKKSTKGSSDDDAWVLSRSARQSGGSTRKLHGKSKGKMKKSRV